MQSPKVISEVIEEIKISEVIEEIKISEVIEEIKISEVIEEIKISEVIEERDRKLFSKIVSNPEHALHELLPVCKQRILRQREHNFILPQIKTERFKRSFINRCLFNYF